MSSSVKIDGLTLTLGNSKMGKVMNISLPPPLSCDTSMPCYGGKCYAMKSAYRMYPEVRKAWDGNWRVWVTGGPAAYFNAIMAAVKKAKPALFRWHVGGDIPDVIDGGVSDLGMWYTQGMRFVADAFPGTRFWCFTKRYDFARANAAAIRKTRNLTVLLSAWPGLKLDGRTRRAWPVVYVRDPKNPDPRIPATAFECMGNCDKCLACADAAAGDAVVINYH